MAQRFSRSSKLRASIWATAIAAIIGVGALTGAQLKTDKQKKEAIVKFRETSAEEQIAMLESRKEALLKQKGALDKKMDIFHRRVAEREASKKSAG